MGREFYKAAAMARERGYWTAAGLLYVHGAIALSDAVSIWRKASKSASENHVDAVALLGEATPGVKNREEALGHLKKIIHEKNRVSYTGQTFRAAEVESIGQHAERFSAWAEGLLREAQ